MPVFPDYATRDELKVQLRIVDSAGDPLTSPIAEDDALDLALTAASRAIDRECHRQFGVEATTATRYYTPDCGFMIDGYSALPIDDVQSTTSMVISVDTAGVYTYTGTLTLGTDVELWPRNAAADGKPWTHLLVKPNAVTYWPLHQDAVRVVAKFGWTAVPAVVHQACLIQAARFFVRRDSAYGVAGSPDVGSEVRLLARLDADVALLLQSVKRYWGAA